MKQSSLILFIFLAHSAQLNEVLGWAQRKSHYFHQINANSEKTATNNASITINELGIELDVLSALNLNPHVRGVNRVSGHSQGSTAWRFHTAFDQAQIPPPIVSELLSRWPPRGSDDAANVSFHFILRQHKKTIATLLSINSPGKMSPWLRLTSNLKNGQQLVFFYHILEDGKLHQTALVLPRIQNWTQILFTVNGDLAELFIDCRAVLHANLVGRINLDFPKDSLIYFRQEPGYKKKFLGAIETAKLFSYVAPRQWNCTNDAKP